MNASSCCILNAGGGCWAFATLARQLSSALWVDVAEEPRAWNYLLLTDDATAGASTTFIPLASIELAADKRLLAQVFAAAGVPTPITYLIETLQQANQLQAQEPSRRYCLKYPTGCGGAGHRFLSADLELPDDWPRPLVVQEFIAMPRPQVYRIYGAGGDDFAFVARRFPAGSSPSPWVAHARGARYEDAGTAPPEARAAARDALAAAGLLDSFGGVDLLQRADGQWLVLEVGTDGMVNHVDRELELPHVELEIQRNVANAFWSKWGKWRPWGNNEWKPGTS